MQASFGVTLGIYRTGFEGSTCLGAAPAWAGRFNVPEVDVGWIRQGGQATHQLEQVISQPLTSSTDSPLPSLRAGFPARPTTVDDTILPFLSVCQSFSRLFQFTCLYQLSVWLRTAALSHPSPVHCIRARTRANNHYAPNILVSRAATTLRHRLPDHLRDETPRQSRNTVQRGARLLAHHIPRWPRAAAPMLVRPDRHLAASQG